MNVGDVSLAHTRLAILDLDDRSNQPMRRGSVALSYNGELWNYRELRTELEALGWKFETEGDTEVLARALDVWGVDALPKLEGMFAFAWTTDGETLHLARDRFGEVPLHVAKQWPFLASSEIRPLLDAGADARSVEWLSPGHRAEVSAGGYREVRWYEAPLVVDREITREAAGLEMRDLVARGVRERSISDVPVCALLSGGVDSSVIAAFLREHVPNLVGYTAVFDPKSSDLRAARAVAEHLEVELVEVVVPPPTSDDLSRVVRAIEMPFKAQVEIGWPCLALADRMKADGFKVTFSGEGSDEVWGAYGYSEHGIRKKGFGPYRRDLFVDQHRKNFARCNKVFMSRSIECRLPYLHTSFVERALAYPDAVVRNVKGSDSTRGKQPLKDSIRGLLPDALIDRSKVAFQTGLGMKEAAAEAVADPRKFYVVEHQRQAGTRP